MAELSIHNVTSIEVKEIDCHARPKAYDGDKGEKFYVRHIVIKDSKGRKFEVTSFADERRSLDLTGEGA